MLKLLSLLQTLLVVGPDSNPAVQLHCGSYAEWGGHRVTSPFTGPWKGDEHLMHCTFFPVLVSKFDLWSSVGVLHCQLEETLQKPRVWNHCNSVVKDILLDLKTLWGYMCYMPLLWNSYLCWSWCLQFLWKSVLWILAKADVFLFQHECYFSNGNHQCKLFFSPAAGWQNQHGKVIGQLGLDEKRVKLEWKA